MEPHGAVGEGEGGEDDVGRGEEGGGRGERGGRGRGGGAESKVEERRGSVCAEVGEVGEGAAEEGGVGGDGGGGSGAEGVGEHGAGRGEEQPLAGERRVAHVGGAARREQRVRRPGVAAPALQAGVAIVVVLSIDDVFRRFSRWIEAWRDREGEERREALLEGSAAGGGLRKHNQRRKQRAQHAHENRKIPEQWVHQ